jgi:hypothetical protein
LKLTGSYSGIERYFALLWISSSPYSTLGTEGNEAEEQRRCLPWCLPYWEADLVITQVVEMRLPAVLLGGHDCVARG